MTLTDDDAKQAANDSKAAKQALADKVLDSLTNRPQEWRPQTLFDQQRLLHIASGLSMRLPVDPYIGEFDFVDAPAIDLRNGVDVYTRSAISSRISEVITNQTSNKLETT